MVWALLVIPMVHSMSMVIVAFFMSSSSRGGEEYHFYGSIVNETGAPVQRNPKFAIVWEVGFALRCPRGD